MKSNMEDLAYVAMYLLHILCTARENKENAAKSLQELIRALELNSKQFGSEAEDAKAYLTIGALMLQMTMDMYSMTEAEAAHMWKRLAVSMMTARVHGPLLIELPTTPTN